VQHDDRQYDELLHDDERYAHDDHQHDQGYVQMRNDKRRHVHDLEQ
jgi:hypothetical protein